MRVSMSAASAAILAVMMATSSVHADGDDFDVAPKIGPANKIVTDAFADATEERVDNVRVFAYEFGEIPEQPLFLPDPGFHPLPGVSGFSPGSMVGFELVAPLRYWSGTGTPAFSNVPADESIRFDFGAESVVSSSAAVPSPAGYSFISVDANGEADDHLETYLLDTGGTPTAPGTPADGLYLATIRVTSTQAGVLASDPIYFVFGNGASEESLEAAVFFARDTFAPGTNVVVPEPTTIGLAAAALATLRRRRNRS
jgi:hypothetical protein